VHDIKQAKGRDGAKIIGLVSGRMVYNFMWFSWCTWSIHRWLWSSV